MKGRFTGSPEERKAGEYIKNEFQIYGLKPLFKDGWFQEFPFIERVELTGSNTLALKINSNETLLKLKTDFITAPFSGNSKYSGEIVFAGYGISASKLNYDDYAGIDVKDKNRTRYAL